MAHIHLQQKAQRDLIGIWQYSCDNWGDHQADVYLDALDQVFRLLADNPDLGVPCDEVRKGLRKLIHEKHLILYRTTGDTIQIIRVLAASMDYEAHLQK